MDEMRDSKGNVIDDAYVEEALADLDTGEPVAIRRGRPSLSAESRESPRVSFRVPEQLAGEVRELSAELDLSVSTIARMALAEYVERHRSTGDR